MLIVLALERGISMGLTASSHTYWGGPCQCINKYGGSCLRNDRKGDIKPSYTHTHAQACSHFSLSILLKTPLLATYNISVSIHGHYSTFGLIIPCSENFGVFEKHRNIMKMCCCFNPRCGIWGSFRLSRAVDYGALSSSKGMILPAADSFWNYVKLETLGTFWRVFKW